MEGVGFGQRLFAILFHSPEKRRKSAALTAAEASLSGPRRANPASGRGESAIGGAPESRDGPRDDRNLFTIEG
jgi:hypothetical protein